MKKSKKITQPWDFVPANFNERANYPAGAGDYRGKGIKARVGRDRVSSTINQPRDKVSGFVKPKTLA